MTEKEKKELEIHVKAIAEARDWVEAFKDTLVEKWESKSAKWQEESEAGQAMSEQIDSLDIIYTNLDNTSDELDVILNS